MENYLDIGKLYGISNERNRQMNEINRSNMNISGTGGQVNTGDQATNTTRQQANQPSTRQMNVSQTEQQNMSSQGEPLQEGNTAIGGAVPQSTTGNTSMMTDRANIVDLQDDMLDDMTSQSTPQVTPQGDPSIGQTRNINNNTWQQAADPYGVLQTPLNSTADDFAYGYDTYHNYDYGENANIEYQAEQPITDADFSIGIAGMNDMMNTEGISNMAGDLCGDVSGSMRSGLGASGNCIMNDPCNNFEITDPCDTRCLTGFMQTQIGRKVEIEFQVGEMQMVSKIGYLLGVGANYIILNELNSNDITTCDLKGMRFIRFFFD